MSCFTKLDTSADFFSLSIEKMMRLCQVEQSIECQSKITKKKQDLFLKLMNSYGVLEPMEFDIEGIPLAMPSFGRNEIKEAMDSLLSGWITMGKKVKIFEERWSNYVGSDYGIAVNSGSEALLVMLSAMIECGYLKRGQEIVLPAIGCSHLYSLLYRQV